MSPGILKGTQPPVPGYVRGRKENSMFTKFVSLFVCLGLSRDVESLSRYLEREGFDATDGMFGRFYLLVAEHTQLYGFDRPWIRKEIDRWSLRYPWFRNR